MSIIPLIETKDAQGKAKEVMEKLEKQIGFVPNTFKAMAHQPEFLEALLKMDDATFSGGQVPRKYKELIAIAVSAANGCQYCLSAHRMLARKAGATDVEIGETMAIVATMSAYNNFNKALGLEIDLK